MGCGARGIWIAATLIGCSSAGRGTGASAQADGLSGADAVAGAGLHDAGADATECATHEDCPDGGWCTGGAGCGAGWTCTPDIPCSAAQPFTACTCSGEWRTLAAGCPEQRYAYVDWAKALYDSEGAPCDPTLPFLRYGVEVKGEGFGPWAAYGAVLRVSSAKETIVTAALSLETGAFHFTWPDLLDVAEPGWTVALLADLDGDQQCTARIDSVWTAWIANPHDFSVQTLQAVIEPTDSMTCEAWER